MENRQPKLSPSFYTSNFFEALTLGTRNSKAQAIMSILTGKLFGLVQYLSLVILDGVVFPVDDVDGASIILCSGEYNIITHVFLKNNLL